MTLSWRFVVYWLDDSGTRHESKVFYWRGKAEAHARKLRAKGKNAFVEEARA